MMRIAGPRASIAAIPPSAGFAVSSNGPTRFIFATEDGTISGWSSGGAAVRMVDNSGAGTIYKGLAAGSSAGSNYLYATDFHNGKVDAFDSAYAPASLPGNFADATIPPGFAPFGIQNINGQLYVTYARQDADKHDDVAGHGHGFVDVFDLNGNFVKRLISGGDLNSPWGLEIAPANFGLKSGSLLVGNFGDGTIGAYDTATGAFLGLLRDTHYNPLRFGDLWDLTLGNGALAANPDTLYFTAGLKDEAHGLFGSIEALNVPEPATALLLLAGLGGLVLAGRR